ncbi:MAG: alpha-amylase family glycosyl hydrolase, partial [Miltoncostaeaceae bacterium]
MDFAVWAPTAGEVAVHVDGDERPMTRDGDGWWRAPAGGPAHGTRYAFSVDGAGPCPDPRSLWQPDGVHARSAVYDHARHAWGDAGWAGRPLAGAVIYELHVGTFTPAGTLAGAAERLDLLVDLGFTHVELMPLAAFVGTHGWGFDGVHLWAVHEPYGGPDALKAFVDACHARGLAVVLDVVYNHLGPSGN